MLASEEQIILYVIESWIDNITIQNKIINPAWNMFWLEQQSILCEPEAQINHDKSNYVT